MSDLKDLMDDLAAEKVTHLRIDLEAAAQDVTTRRDWLRHNGTTVMLAAAAAVVALLALLQPLSLNVLVTPAGTGHAGLPGRWYDVPSYAPAAADDPIGRASMVLSDFDGNLTAVSADGRRYVRLPTTGAARPVALSADGRRVAWVSPESDGDPSPVDSPVHVLELADGHEYEVPVSAPGGNHLESSAVFQLFWAGESLYVRTYDDKWPLSHSETEGSAGRNGGCNLPTAPDASGRLVAWFGERVVQVDPRAACPVTEKNAAVIGTANVVAAPDGQAVVGPQDDVVDDRVGIAIYGAGARRLQMPEDARDAVPLAWTAAGIVVELDLPTDEQLALVNPATGSVRTIGSAHGAKQIPVAVASGLVGDGYPLDVHRPMRFGRVGIWAGLAWDYAQADSRRVVLFGASLFGVLALGLTLRRRARRRTGP